MTIYLITLVMWLLKFKDFLDFSDGIIDMSTFKLNENRLEYLKKFSNTSLKFRNKNISLVLLPFFHTQAIARPWKSILCFNKHD